MSNNRPKVLQMPARDAQPPKEPLLTPQQVVDRYFTFDGAESFNARWVVKHVRPRIMLNRRVVRFYASDVERWIANQREDAA